MVLPQLKKQILWEVVFSLHDVFSPLAVFEFEILKMT